MSTFDSFLSWEKTTRDCIDFKKTYVDMTGDILAGLALSEIIYWYLPAKNGASTKLRIVKGGKEWLACSRTEWWDRARLTPRQVDRVMKHLRTIGVIETEVMRFQGSPVTHIRLIKERFMQLWDTATSKEIALAEDEKVADTVNSISPNGEMDINKTGNSITESTSSVTSKKDLAANAAAQKPQKQKPVSKPNPVYDLATAFVQAFGTTWGNIPKSQHGKWLSVAKDLLSIDTPVQISEVPSLYQYALNDSKRGNWTLTVSSIPARVDAWRKQHKAKQSQSVPNSTTIFYDVTPPDDWYIPRQEFDVFHPVKNIRIGVATSVEEMRQVIAAYDAKNAGAA